MVASTRGDIESRGPRAAWYGTAACAALLLILLWSAELQVNSGVHFSLGTLVGLDEGGIFGNRGFRHMFCFLTGSFQFYFSLSLFSFHSYFSCCMSLRTMGHSEIPALRYLKIKQSLYDCDFLCVLVVQLSYFSIPSVFFISHFIIFRFIISLFFCFVSLNSCSLTVLSSPGCEPLVVLVAPATSGGE